MKELLKQIIDIYNNTNPKKELSINYIASSKGPAFLYLKDETEAEFLERTKYEISKAVYTETLVLYIKEDNDYLVSFNREGKQTEELENLLAENAIKHIVKSSVIAGHILNTVANYIDFKKA